MPRVPEPRRRRTIWLILGLLLVLFLIASAWIPVTRHLGGNCLLEPLRRWTLSERRVGSFESRCVDMLSGEILAYRLHQFDRPAVLDLAPGDASLHLSSGSPVAAGQVVLTLSSSDLELALAGRQTALSEAAGRLADLSVGAKPAELDKARLRHRRAETEITAFRSQYERQQRLHAEGSVSAMEWEEASMRWELMQVDLRLAAAELDVLTSGKQSERIAAAEETLASLRRELAAVESMLGAQALRCPIAGTLRVEPEDGVLLSAEAVDSLVALIYLPQAGSEWLSDGASVTVRIPGLDGEDSKGRLLDVDRRALATERGSYVTARALLPNRDGRLGAGMQGRARIEGGRSTFLRELLLDLRRAARREFGS